MLQFFCEASCRGVREYMRRKKFLLEEVDRLFEDSDRLFENMTHILEK